MNRRQFALIRCLALAAILLAQPAAASNRPNVVLIYTDDQGTLDANCYGSRDLVTPAHDRLAATGLRFTQMYAPSALCSASRAGLLTGRFPVRAGVPGNVSHFRGEAGMPAREITIAEQFKSAGYVTGHVGKWHLGYTPDTMPNGQGFDESFGNMGGYIDNFSHLIYWHDVIAHDLWRNGAEIWNDGSYYPDLMAQECRRFIDAHAAQPFFLYWAINLPHFPLQATAKWREKYSHLPTARREHAACVSLLDEKIGEVLAYLDQRGLRENTIVILQSDHGHSVEERSLGGGGNAGPFRGAKASLFEAGLRVPALVSWPATIPQGEVRDQMVFGCDWFPTLVDLCSLKPAAQPLDGKSLNDVLLKNAPSPHEELFWQLGDGDTPQLALRKGPWKLLVNPADPTNPSSLGTTDRVFLANLDRDRGESTNLAKENPQVVHEMQARLEAIRAGIFSGAR